MITVIIIVLVYLTFHAGHAHANYRHGRAHGCRGVNLFWNSACGWCWFLPGFRPSWKGAASAAGWCWRRSAGRRQND